MLLKILLIQLTFYQVYYSQNESLEFEYYSDVRGENIFFSRINPNQKTFEFILIGDSTYNDIYEITVLDSITQDTIQVLYTDGPGEPPFKNAEYFQLVDLNFDNYKDIMKLHHWGVSGNKYYQIFTFDPEKLLFRFNEFLSNLSSPTVLDSIKELHSFQKLGGGEYLMEDFKYINGEFILVKEVLRKADYQKGIIRETIKVRKNGDLILVKNKIVEEF